MNFAYRRTAAPMYCSSVAMPWRWAGVSPGGLDARGLGARGLLGRVCPRCVHPWLNRVWRFSLQAFLPLAAVVLLASPAAAGESHGGAALGNQLHVATVAPFALLLLAIAVLPLVATHWWEHNKNKGVVAAVLAVPMAIYLFTLGEAGRHALLESVHEYFSFIVLLGSLFVISGGIYVQGSLSGTPLINTMILAIGGAMASFVGTTGASMLLIRPLLRANAPRQRKVHVVVFFIFIVSNCGGLLTPLGDPPLFMGFLRGIPFEWTFQLWPEWLLVNGSLLVIFSLWDQYVFNREEAARPGSQLEEVLKHEPLRIRGMPNFAFLAGLVFTVYASGSGIGNGGEKWPFGWQEGVMIALTVGAVLTTSREIRRQNQFSLGPIIEVAVLFAGIFVTMVPALQILNAEGDKLGVSSPAQFFWATGVLSSFLDNAPTYMTFASLAAGLQGIAPDGRYLATLLESGPHAGEVMAAISCGAVFMGANSYIGNGPNFMVKAIAEENGVRMPSFFGYMVYSVGILVPLFVIVTLAVFR
jgi:Na+/H+ antiporter NhaD/arsenite permease-like protein